MANSKEFLEKLKDVFEKIKGFFYRRTQNFTNSELEIVEEKRQKSLIYCVRKCALLVACYYFTKYAKYRRTSINQNRPLFATRVVSAYSNFNFPLAL